MNTKSFLFIFSPLWMNFAAKHLFLFSITAFVLLCAVDMTDVSCFSHRNFYWQRTTGYLENVELCSMKDCSFEFIATCVSPCWDLFSGRILYPSASPQPWAQWHFKPLSLHNEQWDAGRSHVGRGVTHTALMITHWNSVQWQFQFLSDWRLHESNDWEHWSWK